MSTLQDLVALPLEEQQARGLVHTPREIAQQPATWRSTVALFERERDRLRSFLEQCGVRDAPADRPTILLLGAGTSDYVGQALVQLLRGQWGCEVFACASTDVLPNLAGYVAAGRRYVWISFGRSGDSPEGVAVLEKAMAQYGEIAHLVVTCNAAGRMVALAQQHPRSCAVILDERVNDRSLAMTSSFTNMLLLGQCLAHAWTWSEYAPVFEQLCGAAQQVLAQGFELAQELAARRYPRMCLVGMGPLAAVARESALKILEMSAGQTKTMAETSLGLRHGPMAALDGETLVIGFVAGDEQRHGYDLDLLRELGRKGVAARRLAVAPRSDEGRVRAECDELLTLALDVPDAYRPMVDVIFGQMLGLCNSMEHTCKPDAPSAGDVITRVVGQFAIYA